MRKTPGESESKTPRVLFVVRLLLLFLLAEAASVGIQSVALAAVPLAVGGRAVVVNTDGDPIRVRQGAGTQFPQVSSVHEGQIVSVQAGPSSDKVGTKWFKVQATTGTGWVASTFLEGTSATAAASSRKLAGSARVAYTDGDPLRVREAPTAGASGKVIALLDPDTLVLIKAGPLTDDTGVVWYEITAKGSTGWAMAQYLAPVETAQAANRLTPTAKPVSAEAPVAIEASARSKATATVVPPTATPKPARKPTPRPTAAPVQRAAGPISTLAQYRQWMVEARAAFPYTQSVDKMWSVMMCESGGNPGASGSGGIWLGLFQYAPATWAGSWNPYRNNSIWDAKSQIFATARAWSIGMQGAWSCYYITAGR